MSDFPRNLAVPSHIHSLMRYMVGPVVRLTTGFAAPASNAWTANRAIYVPLYLPWPYNVRRLFWLNGSSVAGNSDIGLYSLSGARFYSSGSTANAGANALQYVTPATDILLGPGPYFLAFANDGAGTVATITPGQNSYRAMRTSGCYQGSSALPLPSAATLSSWGDLTTGLPLIGITNTASGF